MRIRAIISQMRQIVTAQRWKRMAPSIPRRKRDLGLELRWGRKRRRVNSCKRMGGDADRRHGCLVE
jgi:hypothetical protein